MTVYQLNGAASRGIGAGNLPRTIHEAQTLLSNAVYIAPHRVVQPSMQMSEQSRLPSNGSELAAYLMDIRGRDQAQFEKIQLAFLDMFPEFSAINTPMNGTNISIQLQLQSGARRPLASCGTGLEQMLVLLTNVICAAKGQLILLDEPHNFLFPSVEKKFLKVLSSLDDKYFVIATHSAITINSVLPDRIAFVERPGHAYAEVSGRSRTDDIPQILHELGYRNSDLLFHDELIFVEGVSDSELLLGLLRKAEDRERFIFDDHVGCPNLAGTAEYRNADEIQKDVLREEKLIASIGRKKIPHCYLFDGDKAEHQSTFAKTRVNGETAIKFAFLKRYELENYFLSARAIAQAISQELSVVGEASDVSEADIAARLQHWTNNDTNDPLPPNEANSLFPKPLEGSNEIKVKGSRVLEKIYEEFKLTYHKSKSGRLILEFLELSDDMQLELQATTKEIVELLRAEVGKVAST